MSLPQLTETLFKRQRTVFFTVFVTALVVAATLILTLPRQYEATSTLFVGENRPISTGGNAVQLDEVLAQSYANLLKTPEVANDVIRTLPFRISPSALAHKVDFQVLTGTRLIQVTATDQQPRRAQQLADTYARTFVKNQQNAAVDAANSSLQDLNARIGSLVKQLGQAKTASGPSAEARRAQLDNQLGAARGSYRATQESIALQGNNVSMSSGANLPQSPARPRPKLYGLLAALFAFILAVAAALLRDAFDRRVRDEHELTELMGVPILARIPLKRSGSAREQANFNESFEFLRSNLQLRGLDAGPERVIAVTSALPGEGKSTVVSGLSTALAMSGSDVAAVDCDLRKPMLTEYLGAHVNEGVTNVLVGTNDPADLLVPAGSAGVLLLASGPLPPNPSVLVATPAFGRMLARLREEAAYVVIDTPPVTAGADTSAVTAAVDGAVLVVDMDESRRDALVAARDQLEKAGTRLIGLVINRTKAGQHSYGYYGRSEIPMATPNGQNGSNGSMLRRTPA